MIGGIKHVVVDESQAEPSTPPALPRVVQRRTSFTILVTAGACVGAGLLALGLVTALPAAWLASGGDRLPGPGKPA